MRGAQDFILLTTSHCTSFLPSFFEFRTKHPLATPGIDERFFFRCLELWIVFNLLNVGIDVTEWVYFVDKGIEQSSTHRPKRSLILIVRLRCFKPLLLVDMVKQFWVIPFVPEMVACCRQTIVVES